MNAQQDFIDACSRKIHESPLSYFKDVLAPKSFQDVVSSRQPMICQLPDDLQCRYLDIVLFRFEQTFGFQFSQSQQDLIFETFQGTFSHWKTDDWRFFFDRCLLSSYGRLEAYQRSNPQVLFAWMNAYEQERTPYLTFRGV